jgi:hypothetical protein
MAHRRQGLRRRREAPLLQRRQGNGKHLIFAFVRPFSDKRKGCETVIILPHSTTVGQVGYYRLGNKDTTE